MVESIIAVVTFAFSAAAFYFAAERLASRRRQIHARLAGLAPTRQPEAIASTPTIHGSPASALGLEASDWGRRLQRSILLAGLRLRLTEYLLLWLVCVLGFGLLGLALPHLPFMALLMTAIGFILPPLSLSSRREARRRRFDSQITETLTLITAALRSGYSFGRAAQMVAEEMPPPISEEFAWAMGEIVLGTPLEQALGHMAGRMQSYDWDLVTTAVSIHVQVGGNLAEILTTISETIRERIRVQGEIRTLTAEGRLSALVLILLAPMLALFLLLRSPHYFQPLLETRLGLLLLAGAAAGQMIGGFLIKRLVTLDV